MSSPAARSVVTKRPLPANIDLPTQQRQRAASSTAAATRTRYGGLDGTVRRLLDLPEASCVCGGGAWHAAASVSGGAGRKVDVEVHDEAVTTGYRGGLAQDAKDAGDL